MSKKVLKKDFIEENKNLDLTIEELKEVIEVKKDNVLNFEAEIENLDNGLIIEIENGITTLKGLDNKKRKLNQNDYIIKGDLYTIVDKDKRDIKPYVRYLANNKKERFRHNMIMYIAVGLGFALFMIFGMKGDIKKVKTMLEEGQGYVNVVDKTGSGSALDNIMEGFIPNEAKDTLETEIIEEDTQDLGKGGGR